MRLKGPVDLLAIIAASILLVPFIILDLGAMRIIFGLPFILFFPGYALIALLFPRKKDIDWIERIALSFGLSIALVPLAGLLLNYIWEISLYPILVSLEILTIGLCAGACYRRLQMFNKKTKPQPDSEDYFLSWNINISFPEWKAYSKLDKALTVMLVCAIVASVSVLIYVIVTPKTGERFTEFYILGPEGKADKYPTKMDWGQNGTVIIGVANHEYANKTYRIDAILHNESIWTEYVSLPSIPVDIDKNWTKQWEITFNFTISHPSDYRMNFFLFMADNKTELESINPLNETPYRSLHLWVRDFAIFNEDGTALPPLTNGTHNLMAVCDFAREIFESRYGAGAAIDYKISARQAGAEIANASFTVKKINKTSANVTFNGETFQFPMGLCLPLTVNAKDAGEIEFVVLRKGVQIRRAVWNE